MCYLVDIIGVNARVEAHVQVVQHLHHLERGAGGGDGGEAHDVGEEDGHLDSEEKKWEIVSDGSKKKSDSKDMIFLCGIQFNLI